MIALLQEDGIYKVGRKVYGTDRGRFKRLQSTFRTWFLVKNSISKKYSNGNVKEYNSPRIQIGQISIPKELVGKKIEILIVPILEQEAKEEK